MIKNMNFGSFGRCSGQSHLWYTSAMMPVGCPLSMHQVVDTIYTVNDADRVDASPLRDTFGIISVVWTSL